MKWLALQALLVTAIALNEGQSRTELSAGQKHAVALGKAETGHPIQSVMDTIKATAAKGLEDGREEQELMDKFEAQSLKSQKKLSEDIAENEAAKKEMEDESAAKKAAKRSVEEDIEASEKEISNLEAAGSAAADNRNGEIQVETLTKKEHNETISAMKDAIAALEDDKKEIKEAGKKELKASKDYAAEAAAGLLAEKVPSQKVLSLASVRQASEFALLKLDRLSKEEQEMLTSISGGEEEEASPLAGGAPPKKQYKFKSGKVIDLLKKMQMDYEDELQAALMASEKAQMEYDLAKKAREETTKVAKGKLTKQKEHEADVNAKLAELASSLKSTQGELDSDSKTLQDRQMTLKLKKDEFKQRSYMRQREQEAMAYGLKILAKVAGVRHEKPSKSMLQVGSHDVNIKKAHAIEMIRKEAQKSGSESLALLADQVEAQVGTANTPEVGKQVDQMLEKQVWKLKDDQMKDDEKWQWCNSTVSKTKLDKQHKADFIQETEDKLQSADATVQTLTEEIAQAQSKIDETQKTVHEEKMLREETRHDHEDAIRDAKDAQKACADAVKIMEKFYKDAKEQAEAAALIQTGHSIRTHGDGYTDDAGFEGGYAGTSTGTSTDKAPGQEILTLLQTTGANFAEMQADTKAQDAQDQKEFEDLMTDCKKTLESRSTEISLKEQERSRLKEKATGYVSDIKLADRQKASIDRYLEDLAKECVEKAFEERKDARDLEIKSLFESQEELADAFNYKDTAALAAKPMLRGKPA